MAGIVQLYEMKRFRRLSCCATMLLLLCLSGCQQSEKVNVLELGDSELPLGCPIDSLIVDGAEAAAPFIIDGKELESSYQWSTRFVSSDEKADVLKKLDSQLLQAGFVLEDDLLLHHSEKNTKPLEEFHFYEKKDVASGDTWFLTVVYWNYENANPDMKEMYSWVENPQGFGINISSLSRVESQARKGSGAT